MRLYEIAGHKCPTCHGTGTSKHKPAQKGVPTQKKKCPTCKGSKRVSDRQWKNLREEMPPGEMAPGEEQPEGGAEQPEQNGQDPKAYPTAPPPQPPEDPKQRQQVNPGRFGTTV